MRPVWAVLFVASFLLACVGIAAVVIWQANARHIPLQYVIGALMVVVGTIFMILHVAVSDEYLERHFGEPSASRTRQLWRTGCVGVLLGIAMIAAEYFLGPGR